MNKSALLIIDVQVDFCTGGVLAARDTNSLIPNLNNYIKQAEAHNLYIVYTRDWHSLSHKSLKNNGGIWDNHCIQNTKGAEFNQQLYFPKNYLVVNKGEIDDNEGYSAFDATDLHQKLQKSSIKEIIITGIAIEYCVASTAFESLKLGYSTKIVKDLTRGIEVSTGDIENTWQKLQSQGIILVNS
ncbi:isochorismatase family protein [Rickettsiales bacterium LUAb2]